MVVVVSRSGLWLGYADLSRLQKYPFDIIYMLEVSTLQPSEVELRETDIETAVVVVRCGGSWKRVVLLL
jgi:hypothetical protein